MNKLNFPFLNREISWLHFNGRVLQEAGDESVPLVERIKFLSIYSSNLEEFYRVRVATLTRLSNLNDKAKSVLGYNPKRILNEIKKIVVVQERRFEKLFKAIIINGLAANKIFILNDGQLNVKNGKFVGDYFRDEILSNLVPILIDPNKPFPELKDRVLYFFVKINNIDNTLTDRYALIEIPSILPRFLILPNTNNLKYIILLEDIIRYSLSDMFYFFNYESLEAFPIQLTRDAELDIDKNINEKYLDDLIKSLEKRKKGKPMRLLYDSSISLSMFEFLVHKLKLQTENLIPGTRYLKFGDFIKFPNVGSAELEYEKEAPLKVPGLHRAESFFSKISKKDYLINLPYQSFDYIILFLREAAIDPFVTEIQITLYRLAENSKVINALVNAAKNGKSVKVFMEVKARFDERANIFWVNKLKEEGVKVNYALDNYKVHSKICLVKRIENNKPVYYANLATGNYNEKTANLYCDHSVFTCRKAITNDLKKLFDALNERKIINGFNNLIVSPLETRTKFYSLIDREIRNAKKGKPAYILIKVNSLADEGIIRRLYLANNAGVTIKLIVRGICCLIPGIEGFSERITVVSIIDKYLEHARVYIFGNSGKYDMYLSSADMMTRNIDHRVEVTFPILDKDVKQQLVDILDIQLQDNVKAREINQDNNNKYHKNKLTTKVRAQLEIYKYLKSQQNDKL